MHEEVYRSNIVIMYKGLEEAINRYRNNGKEEAAVYVRAYLPALLNAIASYQDSVLKKKEIQETTEILACKYANNRLKHNAKFASFTHETQGGFTFPISFPVVIPAPDVRWIEIPEDELLDEDAKGYVQQEAYKDLFEKRPVLETLKEAIVATSVTLVS